MARWQFVLGTLNGPETDLTYALGRVVNLRLSEPSTAEFTIDGRTEQALNIRELVSTLTVYRNGEPLFYGIVGSTSDVIDANQHILNVTAVDFRARLERLLIDTDTTYTNQQIKDIAWNLIDTAQQKPGADLGITEGSAIGGTSLTTITFESGMSVFEAINTLQEAEPGFDWDILTDSTFQLWDSRGTAAGVIIDYGGLATGVEIQFEPTNYANAVRVSGGTATTSVVAAGTAFGPEGRWESQAGFGQIQDQDILQEAADKLLADSSEIKSAIGLTLTDGEGAPRWGGPSNIFLGDTCRMVIKSGRIQYNDLVRVQEIDCAIGDSGEEAVTLTLDAPAVRFAERIRNQERRLARLERQP
jgi:hypothetical protein